MAPTLHDPQDITPLWSTFNIQRALGVGIVALSSAPLFQDASIMWGGPARGFLVAAIVVLTMSVLIAQGSLVAHRRLAIQYAQYGNTRREKEFFLEQQMHQAQTADRDATLERLNKEDQEIAEKAEHEFKRVVRWLWAQYATAMLGALLVIATIVHTPGA